MKSVDFYFDFGSTASYIAYKALPRITEKASATINWKPVLLGGVFKATGNVSPASVAAKSKWVRADMAESARRYEVPMQSNPFFPIMTLPLMRGAIGLKDHVDLPKYMDTVFDAIWVDGKNMSDPAVIGATLTDAGFEPAEFMALISDPDVKAGLIKATDEAIEKGMFGAPMMYVDDKMFFGQDRLYLVAEALGVNILDVFPKYIEL